MNIAIGQGNRSIDRAEASNVYRLSPWRTFAHTLLSWFPPPWREPLAEAFLRRRGAPAPALEHVMQYRLSLAKAAREKGTRNIATVARGADNFYEKQYRQYLTPQMGVFAQTAIQAVIASGTDKQGWFGKRHRRTVTAVVELPGDVPPIVVIDKQTVAVAVLLPASRRQGEALEVVNWLHGQAGMPTHYRSVVQGRSIPAAGRGTRARERRVDGSTIDVCEAAIRLRRLALLALHPYDPDAMGLHITLFDVMAVSADELERDHGLEGEVLQAHRTAALAAGRQLFFLVGATEETFTQCSQNLFIKRRVTLDAKVPQVLLHSVWRPEMPLSLLLSAQFELIQVTISAAGLPGASPRNGDLGKAGFIGYQRERPYLLIPYFPGNAVHGHAAKLISNPNATVIIADDHRALTRVTLSGPCRTVNHQWVQKQFAAISHQALEQNDREVSHGGEPEYWFVQLIEDIVQETEQLAANTLDPNRPTCSISAGGHALHNKKPAYFEANRLPRYDRHLQHERERFGRVIDHSGIEHRLWLNDTSALLKERQLALQQRDAEADCAKLSNKPI